MSSQGSSGRGATRQRPSFEVAVIGGGPAGAATAIALARGGARVVLLERSESGSLDRGETLPPRTRLLLARLGVWATFLRQRHAPSPATVSAWGSDVLHEKHFICSPYGHGWCVDRRRLDEGLTVAAEEAGARVMRGARAVACRPGAGPSWRISYVGAGGAGSLRADWFVDATGRASALARAQGVNRLSHDSLVGIVASFPDRGSGEGTDPRTLVEAVANGWWYSARLPNARVVAAYMSDTDLVREARGRLREYFIDQLEDAPHTRGRLGRCPEQFDFAVMPANSSRLERAAGVNWLAVGDAAMAQDPLSSQGVCRALESGLDAAAVIVADAGVRASAIARYEGRMRRAFEGYLRQRAAYYAVETRWRQSAFWRRRSAARSAGPIG